ncbi:universal stress protein [Nocardia huaxiensis]|uniref:Universal stress protein n=1 Tax=Nocardia huaxiensis TaxID=2755382 RepID=A0A7D6YZP0_9NOCA|nr:universal stress protein [Nocardia huaxiensis]QLY28606.1 universal stress protein [Nocardia huaxiensis]
MADNAVPAPGTGIPPIVAAVDGSEISYQAVAWAAVEAELRGSPLHIITSYAIPTREDARTALGVAEVAALRADGARVLAEATRIAEHATPQRQVEITTEFTFDLIIPTLLARSKQAAMIVVGNRGRGAVRRALLGSVSTALSRHAHCPVTIVHGISQTDPVSATKPIVVGVDGTDNSMPAIEMAFEEAARRKVALIAVHAWSDTTGYDLPVVGWDSIRETEQTLLAESLAGFGERYPEVTVERVVACDTAVRALLEQADSAQLLVVGSHGRSGFAGIALGSVSAAVLHHAVCPVLVVRER